MSDYFYYICHEVLQIKNCCAVVPKTQDGKQTKKKFQLTEFLKSYTINDR